MIEALEKLSPTQIQEFLILDYLKRETGFNYRFAIATSRPLDKKDNWETRDEGYHQIMPHGIESGFFPWYVMERQYNQFFETKEEAFVEFLKYWKKWKSMSN